MAIDLQEKPKQGGRAQRPVWMEKPSFALQACKATVLTLICISMLFPFVYVIAISFSTYHDVLQGGLILIPRNPTLEAYRQVLSGGIVTRALTVSIGLAVFGTAAQMIATVSLAYGLSKPDVPGSRFVLFVALGTFLFSPGIIPLYLLVQGFGLLDTYPSLILPGLISAFNLVVVRNFFMNIPPDILDSARLDGAGNLGVLVHIVLPLSKAVIAVISLFYAVNIWNTFFNALLYMRTPAKWPIQVVLQQYVLQGTPLVAETGLLEGPPVPPHTIQMAVLVVATVPILLVYPFLQRYFTKGVLTGAIK